jgi:hypothetical protein
MSAQGLAAIQKRREESITTEHEESVSQQIFGWMTGLNDATDTPRRNGVEPAHDTLTREAIRCASAMAS